MDVSVSINALSSAVKDFISKPRRLLIDGQWVEAKSGKTFAVYDPSTGQQIAEVAEADAADVNLAVAAARRAFGDSPWAVMKPTERARLLWKLADLMEANADELAELESLDNGKPVTVAKSADVPFSIETFRYMAGWPTKLGGKTLNISAPGDYHSYILREPVGVVGQIIPWNFPLLMAARKLGPALATGCTVVLKPAEQTPLTALRVGELIMEAGFPPGVVNILPGFGETAGAAIANHPDVEGGVHGQHRGRQDDRPRGDW